MATPQSFIGAVLNEFAQILRDKRRMVLVFRLYGYLGYASALIAALLLGAEKLNIKINASDQPFVAAIIIGAILGVASSFAISYLRERDKLENFSRIKERLSFSLIQSWIEFEEEAQAIIFGKEDGKPTSIRFLIRELARKEILSSEKITKLEEALLMRNMIVHGQTVEYTNTNLIDALQNISDASLELAAYEHSKKSAVR